MIKKEKFRKLSVGVLSKMHVFKMEKRCIGGIQ
jgi:hypothetical protein